MPWILLFSNKLSYAKLNGKFAPDFVESKVSGRYGVLEYPVLITVYLEITGIIFLYDIL